MLGPGALSAVADWRKSVVCNKTSKQTAPDPRRLIERTIHDDHQGSVTKKVQGSEQCGAGTPTMRLKERIIRWGMAAVVRSGADRRLAGRARGMGVILMLHHVRPWEPREFAPNRLLEVTPEFLDSELTVAYEEGFEQVTLVEDVWRT